MRIKLPTLTYVWRSMKLPIIVMKRISMPHGNPFSTLPTPKSPMTPMRNKHRGRPWSPWFVGCPIVFPTPKLPSRLNFSSPCSSAMRSSFKTWLVPPPGFQSSSSMSVFPSRQSFLCCKACGGTTSLPLRIDGSAS
jgi:hypothetical protein